MKFVKKIFFAFVATLLGLLALEALSWIGGYAEQPDPLIVERRPEWNESREHDRLLFWRLRPHWVQEGNRVTNRLGLRGPEVDAKQPDELRILSLGESTTFAPNLAYEQSYSALLERRLANCLEPERELSRRSERSVRVINGGVSGYSLFQGVTYLEHRGLELGPDVVLLYFGHNDFLPVTFRAVRDAGDGTAHTDRERFENQQRWPVRATALLERSSNLYRTLLSLYEGSRLEATMSQERIVRTEPNRPRVPAADRRALLAKALDLSREHNFELVLLVPWYRSFDRHESLLRTFAAEHNLPLIDLPRELQVLPHPRHSYFRDSIHPTAEGHQAIAEVVGRRLLNRWGCR